MICMYCEATTINEWMTVVREAIKPPNTANRWLRLGHCCESCEAAGEATAIDKYIEKEQP